MIEYECDCGHEIRATDEWVGTRINCPMCDDEVVLPKPTKKPKPRPKATRAQHGVSADLINRHGIEFHSYEHLDAGPSIGDASGPRPAKVITYTKGGIFGPPKAPPKTRKTRRGS